VSGPKPAGHRLDVPAVAFVVALAGLSGMGPARLRALLHRWHPEQAWQAVLGGQVHLDARVVESARRLDAHLSRRWCAEASTVDVAARWRAHASADVAVTFPGEAGYPDPLVDDLEAPAVLFHLGRMGALGRPRVALVGTRRCTAAGRATARELGRDLAVAGVCVVSGLASGIDGEAHLGALAADAAAPVAVVATGLDVVYPRANADLWRRVATAGCVVSEYPLGTRPERWRFPARNRIIAGLADVVVVVESHAKGGSLHTVDAALERDRPVMAVPGSVRSPASVGTNGLLAAGCAVARDVGDILALLGLDAAATGRGRPGGARPPDDGAAAVVEALGWEPATVEELARRLQRPLGRLAVELSELEHDGWVTRSGTWYERTVRPG
jgi:DNA processing protein